MLLLPLLIAAAAVVGLAGWVLVAAATIKTADLSLRHTQMRSALEVMLLPLPARLRERTKRLIELVLYRAAQAATALVVLLGLQVAPLEFLPLLESLLVIGVIGWLVAAWQTRRGYLRAFHRSLTGPGGLDLDRVDIDGASRRELRQALASSDPMVVRLALRLIERRRRYKLVPRELLEHSDPAVAEHAAVLVASIPRNDPHPRRRGRLGGRDLVSRAQDGDPRVRAEAARAMGVHGSSRFLPHLLVLLADHRTRAPAREATVAIGDRALPYLVRALRDPTLPHAVRLHVPRTLARFDVRRVGPILLRQVAIERDKAVLYKLLRALGSLRRQEPNLSRRSSALRRALRQNLALAGRLEHRRRQMEQAAELDPDLATRTHDLLLDLLAAKRDNTLERVLRLIDLERPRLDLLRLLPAARAPARRAPLGSMLGEALPGRLAESMRWLFDPGAPVPSRRVVGPHLQTEPTAYVEVLGVLAEDESRSLSTLARVRLAELQLPVAPSFSLRPDHSGSRASPPWLLLRQVTAWIEQGPRRLPA